MGLMELDRQAAEDRFCFKPQTKPGSHAGFFGFNTVSPQKPETGKEDEDDDASFRSQVREEEDWPIHKECSLGDGGCIIVGIDDQFDSVRGKRRA